mgnify:CR=1 FL=1
MIAAGGHARFAWVVQTVGRSTRGHVDSSTSRDAGSIPAPGAEDNMTVNHLWDRPKLGQRHEKNIRRAAIVRAARRSPTRGRPTAALAPSASRF